MIRKFASGGQHLGSLEVSKDGLITGFRRTASGIVVPSGRRRKSASYYADGARKIDVGSILAKVASKYQISQDPDDYLFEAIRANSVNDPNENNDNFRREEVLRFSPRYIVAATGQIGAPVYQTYVGKPHFVNHAAEDPARARGVVIDASYNDLAGAFDVCPTCNTETSHASKRTASGIECANCFDIVKDEFVETLVAVDKKKDKRFAQYVEEGLFDAVSMGCSCGYTTCGVCQHVARSTQDFCDHIRHKKGSLWLARPNGETLNISADDARQLIKAAGYSEPDRQDSRSIIATLLRLPDGSIIKRAHEDCWEVEYDELSRVDHPADPKALRTEMMIAKAASLTLSLEDETEMLKSAITKIANVQNTIEGSDMKNMSSKRAQVGPGGKMPINADVQLNVPDGARVHVQEPLPGDENQPVEMIGPDGVQKIGPDGKPLPPEAPGIGGVRDSMDNEGPSTNEEFGLAEDGQPLPQGIQPPGASLEMQAEIEAEVEDGEYVMKESKKSAATNPAKKKPVLAGKKPEFLKKKEKEEEDKDVEKDAACGLPSKKKASTPFLDTYENFEAEASENSVVVYDAAGRMVFQASLVTPAKTADARDEAAIKVLMSIAEKGLVRTAKQLGAKFHGRIASATADAMFDFEGPSDSNEGALDGADDDMKEDLRSMAESVLDDALSDIEDGDRDEPDSSLEGAISDLAEKAKATDDKSSTDSADDDISDAREPFNVGKDNTLDGAHFDRKAFMKDLEENTRKLYASRLKKVQAEMQTEKEALEAEFETRLAQEKETMKSRYERALKIAARRAALNLEESPLKVAVIDSLTVPRTVGKIASRGPAVNFSGLKESLALHLTEAAWADAAQEEVDTLLTRTAEIMEYDDRYLADAERDLSKQSAVIPPVTDSLEDEDGSMHREASYGDERSRLVRGNLVLAPTSADDGTGTDPFSDALSDIVWSNTRIGRRLSELGNLE